MTIEKTPNSAMMAPVTRLMRFMETGDQTILPDIFARENVILLDSFAPYVFQGPHAAANWAQSFIGHAKNLTNLRHTLGQAQEFSQHGETTFFSQALTWEGETNGKPFHETGGLALLLVRQDDEWRVQNYGWAATSFVLK